MQAKYNFQKLKDEFVRGAWLSVSAFLRARNIPSSSYTRAKAKGWLKEKIDFQKKIIAQVREKTVESESEIRLRQQRAAKFLQYKGLKKLEELPIETIDTKEARKLLVEGLQQEREALGFDRGVKVSQINIGYSGKTELDKFLESANYEQVLELIAEIKREKARRESTRTGASI